MSEPQPKTDCRAALPVGVEWRTLLLILLCYAIWLLVLVLLPTVSLTLTVLCLGGLAALHSSLSHEALHGHPFRSRLLNEGLVFLPLTLVVPYRRFQETHLAHHRDERLTDPYDDPETNYLDPVRWERLPGWRRMLLRINNTLMGRMVLGPLMGQICFMAGDWRQLRAGNRRLMWDWALHGLGLALVIAIVQATPAPIWALCLGGYLGLGLLKIRTFLEHRAHEDCQGRTVVIEDNGPLAWLFLHNNLHIVHHLHPGVPWYALPGLYRRNRARYLAANQGYHYRSYTEVFARYLLRSKDPVPHPLWSSED